VSAAWVPCVGGCGDYWCRLHDQHAHECECPPLEEWPVLLDPYTNGGPREGAGTVKIEGALLEKSPTGRLTFLRGPGSP
jgi:hypothetical protein